MRHLISAALVILMACGGTGPTVEDFREASPSAQHLDVSMRAAKDKGLVGDPALMPGVTALTTFIVNGSVAWILGSLAVVVADRPASISGNTAVWGPYKHPLWREAWRVTMTKEDDGFHSVVEARPRESTKDEDFVVVMKGVHRPGVEAGEGEFSVDFTAMQKLPSKPNSVGQGVVEYARQKRDVTLTIHFVQTGDPQKTERSNSTYRFAQVDEGDGFFEFAIDNDYDKTSPALEHLSIKSRWMWDGSGRADAYGSGGDVKAPFQFNECWDTAHARRYYSDTLGLFATEGDSKDCVYVDASLPSMAIAP